MSIVTRDIVQKELEVAWDKVRPWMDLYRVTNETCIDLVRLKAMTKETHKELLDRVLNGMEKALGSTRNKS